MLQLYCNLTVLVFQAAMVSGAALALPAQFQEILERIIASPYVTYAALPLRQRVGCLCVCLLQLCL